MHIYHFSISGGLPEIYGTVGINGGNYVNPVGCFYSEGSDSQRHTANTGTWNARLAIRASRSSSIYGAYSGVRPDSILIKVKTRCK